MSRSRFLWPTGYKLLFLVEWTFYCGGLVVLRRGVPASTALNLAWPFAALYVAACLFVAASRRPRAVLRDSHVYLVAMGLLLLDQALKSAVAASLALDESIALIAGGLHVVHVRNPASFMANALHLAVPSQFLLAISVALSAVAPLAYRFYIREHRPSFWSQAAFVFLGAAFASAAIEYGLRGFVLDYVSLPGVVACDLKDIYSKLGTAALVIEAFDNPQIPRRWRGWRTEALQLRDLAARFAKFALGELRRPGRSP